MTALPEIDELPFTGDTFTELKDAERIGYDAGKKFANACNPKTFVPQPKNPHKKATAKDLHDAWKCGYDAAITDYFR